MPVRLRPVRAQQAQLAGRQVVHQKTLWAHFPELVHLCNFPVIAGSLGSLSLVLWPGSRGFSYPTLLSTRPRDGRLETERKKTGIQFRPSFGITAPPTWERGRFPSLIVLAPVELQPLQPLSWIAGCKKMERETSTSSLSFRNSLFCPWARSRGLLLHFCLFTSMATSVFWAALTSGPVMPETKNKKNFKNGNYSQFGLNSGLL